MDKIIEILSRYFSPKFREKLLRVETLEALIIKLEKKEHKLKVKLNELDEGEERNTTITQLDVLKAQKEKAIQLLNEESDVKE